MGANLANRVAERASEATGQEVERRDAPLNGFALIESMKPQIQRALPRGMDADRMARLALTSLRTVRFLGDCTMESLAGALMNCSQLGLEPGPIGEAYLVPFKNSDMSRRTGRDVYEATLIIGYKGMLKLFWQSPLAESIGAETVYENDEFDYAYGLKPYLVHKPAHGARGEAICWYAVATMTQGGSRFVVMWPEEIERIKARARAKESGPWKTDYDAMAKKTAIRQMFRWLPQSQEMAYALVQDGAIRTDDTPEGIDKPPRYVEPDPEPPALNEAEESMYCAGCARVMKPAAHAAYVATLPESAQHDPAWEHPGEVVQ